MDSELYKAIGSLCDEMQGREIDEVIAESIHRFQLPEQAAWWAVLKYKGEQDLYFWNIAIMGYTDIKEQPHREMCNFLMFDWHKLLCLVPRDTFKSSICTVGQTLQDFAKNIELTAGLWSETEDQIKKKTLEMKHHCEQNETFRAIYGNWIDTSKWTELQLNFKPRKGLVGGGQPSIMGAGIDASKTGIHYDIAVYDDLHGESNTGTKDQVEKTVYQFGTKVPYLKPGGRERMVGTRWHGLDIYGKLIDGGIEWTPDLKPSDITDRNAWVYYHKGCFDGPDSVFFPDRYDREKLEKLREFYFSIGNADHFTAQYINRIVDDAYSEFKLDWIEWETPEERWKDHFLFDIVFDGASSDTRKSDYTAMVLVGSKGIERHIVDWEMFRTRNTLTVLDRLASMAASQPGRFRNIYMQKAAVDDIYFRALQDSPKEEYRSLAHRVRRIKMMTSMGAKNSRIRGLIIPFQTRQIKIFAHLKNTAAGREFIEEYRLFPKAPHDDIMDALANLYDQTFPSKREEGKIKKLKRTRPVRGGWYQ